MSLTSTETRGPVRRALVRAFPGRQPRTKPGRAALLAAVRATYRLADWIAHNAETVMLELDHER